MLDDRREDWFQLEEQIPEMPEGLEITEFSEYFFEELGFGVNCVDRILNATIGAQRKGNYLEELVDALQLELTKRSKQFGFKGLFFRDLVVRRQAFYATLQFPEANQNLKGTLFWEYGKQTSLRCAVCNPIAVTEVAVRGMFVFKCLTKIIKGYKF